MQTGRCKAGGFFVVTGRRFPVCRVQPSNKNGPPLIAKAHSNEYLISYMVIYPFAQ